MFSLCLSLVYSHCCEGVSSRKGGVGDLRSAVPYRDVTSQIYRWCTASPLVSCPPSIFPPSFSLSCFCFNGFHAFCQSQKTYKTVRHRPFFNVVKNQYQYLVVSLLFLFKDYIYYFFQIHSNGYIFESWNLFPKKTRNSSVLLYDTSNAILDQIKM